MQLQTDWLSLSFLAMKGADRVPVEAITCTSLHSMQLLKLKSLLKNIKKSHFLLLGNREVFSYKRIPHKGGKEPCVSAKWSYNGDFLWMLIRVCVREDLTSHFFDSPYFLPIPRLSGPNSRIKKFFAPFTPITDMSL